MKTSPRNLAMNWLARREHSQAELREKLAARDVEPEVIEATVTKLASDGLVSDERFAEAFVAVRMRKGQGPVRIRAELKRRGVSSTLVSLYVDEAGLDWAGLACKVRAKKFGEGVPPDFAAKAKQMRFLEYRGFSTDHIQAALNADA